MMPPKLNTLTDRAPLALALALAMIGMGGCETNDVGKLCEAPDPGSVGDEPVGGENPDHEVVRLTRDGACESFKCLRHLGLAPYCTATCEFIEKDTAPSACDDDADCGGDESCAQDGFCREDSCPAGFACRTVHETGPHQEDFFCTRRVACESNLACGNLGEINCQEHLCFDRCLLQEDPTTCEFSYRQCEPVSFIDANLECHCEDPGFEVPQCPRERLICSLPSNPNEWEAGAIKRADICVEANPERAGDTAETDGE